MPTDYYLVHGFPTCVPCAVKLLTANAREVMEHWSETHPHYPERDDPVRQAVWVEAANRHIQPQSGPYIDPSLMCSVCAEPLWTKR